MGTTVGSFTMLHRSAALVYKGNFAHGACGRWNEPFGEDLFMFKCLRGALNIKLRSAMMAFAPPMETCQCGTNMCNTADIYPNTLYLARVAGPNITAKGKTTVSGRTT